MQVDFQSFNVLFLNQLDVGVLITATLCLFVCSCLPIALLKWWEVYTTESMLLSLIMDWT